MKISKEDRLLYIILHLVLMGGTILIALLTTISLFYFWLVWGIGVIFFILVYSSSESEQDS